MIGEIGEIGTGLDAVQPWLTTGGILGILAFATRVWIINRQLSMKEKTEDRQGYGELIKVMQEQLKSMQESIGDLQRQLGECRAEHAASKQQVRDLTAQVEGLHRQLVKHSAEVAVQLPAASDAVRDAARRAIDIVGGDDA